jgi:ribonuclease HI
MLCYTDGSCIKHKCGGWAFCAYSKNIVYNFSGSVADTTNQVMELTAMEQCLLFLSKRALGCKCITIHTDSKYVCNGLNTWIHSWMSNGWNNGKVMHKDIWQRAYKYLQCIRKKNHVSVKIVWVKAHTGLCRGNDNVDRLAKEAAKKVFIKYKTPAYV